VSLLLAEPGWWGRTTRDKEFCAHCSLWMLLAGVP